MKIDRYDWGVTYNAFSIEEAITKFLTDPTYNFKDGKYRVKVNVDGKRFFRTVKRTTVPKYIVDFHPHRKCVLSHDQSP